MKKIISLLLVIVFLSIHILPTFADNTTNIKIDLKKAIEIAKKSFDLDTVDYDFNQSYNESDDGQKQWNLSWNSKKTNTNINVSVDADTGDISSMYRWDPVYAEPPKIAMYSREEALKASKEILYRLQPEKSNEMKLLEPSLLNNYGYDYDSYSFQYIRLIDGIPFKENGVNIGIDKNSLELKNYNFNWYKGVIPASAKAISIEDGKNAFNEKNALELSYIIRYDNKLKKDKAILVYCLKGGNRPIDAFTGEIIKNLYYGVNDMGAGAGGGTIMNSKQESLTPEEIKATEDITDYISKEEALEIGEKYCLINKNQSLTYASLYSYDNGKNARWNLNWNYNDSKNEEYAYSSISIDAVTGEVLDFYKSDSNLDKLSQGKPKYSKEQCKILAESFLKEIASEKFKQTEYNTEDPDYEIDNPKSYQFSYTRKVNGIICQGNSLRVTVNNFTGNIMNYYNNWANIEFPKIENILSLEEAYDNLYNNVDFGLRYIMHYNYEFKSAKSTVRLVYAFEQFSGMLDPYTGLVLDYDGEIIKDKNENGFIDIEGHWAEDDILALIEAGILKADSEIFSPNLNIKQKDFISILIKSLQPYYPIIPLSLDNESTDEEYEEYYKQAILRKIIKESEKDLEAQVSRIEAAKMIINAMGLGFLASKQEIFCVKYADDNMITDELKGYAAIVTGLEIMKGNSGYFYPDKSLTRAEAASLVLKYLKVEK
ncbi:MAG: S-layer homology domain-containing protein [Firmicutes bacterium]|nr:S-layer homology domain-containing protein [Bacillota bacterium]